MRWGFPAKSVSGGGEGKSPIFRSRLKWVGLLGLILSAVSLSAHFLLARYSLGFAASDFKSSITIFTWRPVFENAADLYAAYAASYKRYWGPVKQLQMIHPYADPRGNYVAPPSKTNGYIFVRIRGGFHEIRNSIADVVVVARLLNASLVIPEVQSTTSSKGISTQFKSFAYLYNEELFMAALKNDVKILKTLPKDLKGARRKKEIPSFKVSKSAPPYFYLHRVLPMLFKHSVVELIVSDGGCLQALLPWNLEEYQRLRCRVAFHALKFRDEIQELATKILYRLRTSGRPFIAYDPGMTRDALAYHGCAELFQDVHTELIQHKRAWMLKRGIVKGNLSVDSSEQHRRGLCPLMPEEIGILLRAYGYSWDTVIYLSGGEAFGGQKKLIPLHAMFENVVDRTSLSLPSEWDGIYGREANLVDKSREKEIPSKEEEKKKTDDWRASGPRPRPLPPPPPRQKYPYNVEGWWGWVAESDDEPETTVMELRMNAHKLLWEAVDYTVCVEADVFVPGFDFDGKGNPNFASLVMGHRMYRLPTSKTFRMDRREMAELLDDIRDNLYQPNRTWIAAVRKHLHGNQVDGLKRAADVSKPHSFLSFPLPECGCSKRGRELPVRLHGDVFGSIRECPSWMTTTTTNGRDERENESDDVDEEEEVDPGPTVASILFNQVKEEPNDGGAEVERSSKEETQMEDQEELEGGER